MTAAWRQLVMLNYAVEPRILEPLVPTGTELDLDGGVAYASIVGFQFLDSRLFGVRIPLHGAFEEVNLRFYVRRRVEEGWRRGVVFVRELAPRAAVTFIARTIYAENYATVPMTSRIESSRGPDGSPRHSVEYSWRFAGRRHYVAIEAAGECAPPRPNSHQEFIVEHYWAYTAWPSGATREYRVAHPPWRIVPAATATLDCDIAAVYGREWAPFLTAPPASAFLADGSPVRVYRGRRIA